MSVYVNLYASPAIHREHSIGLEQPANLSIGPVEWVHQTFYDLRLGNDEFPDGLEVGTFDLGVWYIANGVWSDLTVATEPEGNGYVLIPLSDALDADDPA